MTQSHQLLYDEVLRLPLEKVGKAISYVRFLESEPEPTLMLDPAEEVELHSILSGGETVSANDLLEKIKALPND